MAVWWVFQNQSYERSRDGGYIWAPLVDKAGHKKSHWEVLQQVRPETEFSHATSAVLLLQVQLKAMRTYRHNLTQTMLKTGQAMAGG